MIEEIVTLVVGGKQLMGFQEVNVTRSMEAAAITFGLKATNPAWHEDAWALRLGAEVELYSNGTLLCRGYIDNYEADHGEGASHDVRVSGRSKAADAIDCPPAKHKTGRVEGKTLEEVAKEFDEFGIGYKADVPLKAIPKVQRYPTDSVHDTLEREAREQGLMLMGQPDGSVLITRAGSKRHAGALVEGRPPIKKFGVKFSAEGKFSEVTAKAQRALGTKSKDLREEVKEYDPEVGRYRPLIVFLEGDGTEEDLKTRAQWERLRRQGSGTSVPITTSTWRDEAGEIWEPGRLMAIVLPSERVDQDMTLSSVTFTQNHQGTTASLTFVDPRSHGGKDPKGKSDKAYGAGKALKDDGKAKKSKGSSDTGTGLLGP
jgi:prophage tail gpP-like protein